MSLYGHQICQSAARNHRPLGISMGGGFGCSRSGGSIFIQNNYYGGCGCSCGGGFWGNMWGGFTNFCGCGMNYMGNMWGGFMNFCGCGCGCGGFWNNVGNAFTCGLGMSLANGVMGLCNMGVGLFNNWLFGNMYSCFCHKPDNAEIGGSKRVRKHHTKDTTEADAKAKTETDPKAKVETDPTTKTEDEATLAAKKAAHEKEYPITEADVSKYTDEQKAKYFVSDNEGRYKLADGYASLSDVDADIKAKADINTLSPDQVKQYNEQDAKHILENNGIQDGDNIGTQVDNEIVLELLSKAGFTVKLATNDLSEDKFIKGKISNIKKTDGKISFTIDCKDVDGAAFGLKYDVQQQEAGVKKFVLTTQKQNTGNQTLYTLKDGAEYEYNEGEDLLARTSSNPLVSKYNRSNLYEKIEEVEE